MFSKKLRKSPRGNYKRAALILSVVGSRWAVVGREAPSVQAPTVEIPPLRDKHQVPTGRRFTESHARKCTNRSCPVQRRPTVKPSQSGQSSESKYRQRDSEAQSKDFGRD